MAEHPDARKLAEEVGKKEQRKQAARRSGGRSVWFGLGMFGLVGWSVAIPSLLGVAVGVWLDRQFPSRASWTLTGLVVGVALGCLNAWYWLKQAEKS